jgi:hypothetical protein
MRDITEELGWMAGFAVVTGVLLYALIAATSWAATMLGAWVASF